MKAISLMEGSSAACDDGCDQCYSCESCDQKCVDCVDCDSGTDWTGDND